MTSSQPRQGLAIRPDGQSDVSRPEGVMALAEEEVGVGCQCVVGTTTAASRV